MLRGLLTASVLLASPTAPASVRQEVISPKAVLQVICPMTGGYSAGTAVRVGKVILSVNHVTASGNCLIDGKPVSVMWHGGDFSMLEGTPGPYLKIDCGGFVSGHRYLALGYARGIPALTAVDLVATGRTSGPFSILTGIFTVVPGQSGGPVIDLETGKVVGLVNVYDFQRAISGSLALSDTPLCKGHKA